MASGDEVELLKGPKIQTFFKMSDNAQSRWSPTVKKCILNPNLGLSGVPKGLNLPIKWPFEGP